MIFGQDCLIREKYLSIKIQILLGTFILCMVVISKGYSCLLISNLTKSISYKRMETLEDVSNSDSEIILFPGTYQYNEMVKSNDPIDAKILDKYHSQENVLERKTGDYSFAAYNDKTVQIGSPEHMAYALMARFTTVNGKSSAYLGKPLPGLSWIGFAINKGTPLEDEISKQ
jgi:hypothetical protein